MSTAVNQKLKSPNPETAGVALLRRVINEPLVHFVLIAAAIVCAQRVYAIHHNRFRIVMTAQRVTQVAESYRLQFGVDPGRELTETLIDDDFEDEALYRTALALNLDRDDEIIRRRLIQKMRFVTQDQHVPPEPTDAQLRAYFTAHHDKYRRSAAATFTHVFFSADADGAPGGRRRAAAMLQRLNQKAALRAPDAGDVFPDHYDFSSYEPQQVNRLFGEMTGFSEAVFIAPVGCWSGPYQSAYGWHLLRVSDRKPAIDASFEQVRDRVRNDYLDEAQNKANAAALAAIKKQYTFVRDDRQSGIVDRQAAE